MFELAVSSVICIVVASTLSKVKCSPLQVRGKTYAEFNISICLRGNWQLYDMCENAQTTLYKWISYDE